MGYFKKYRCIFSTIDNKSCELSIYKEYSSQPSIVDVTCTDNSVKLIMEEINFSDSFISAQRLDFELITNNNYDYHDLYSVDPFASRVELSINNELVYVGWIDPESYEEPFSRDVAYPVRVKSGNLKLLKRLDFAISVVSPIKTIIAHIINKVIPNAVISYDIDTKAYSGSKRINIEDLSINPYVFFSPNSFDSPKCYQVLEEICKAFQLRVEVNANRVEVRDIVSMRNKPVGPAIKFLGGSDLRFDEVYNKINITLDLSTDKPIKSYKIDGSMLSGIAGQRISIYQGQSNPSLENTAFYYKEKQITAETHLDGITVKASPNTFLAKINAYFEGSDATFIRNKAIERIGSGRVIASFDPVPINISNTEDWFLNIKLDTMLSVLTDPFGNANRAEGASNWWRNHENDYLFDSTLVQIPLNVVLKDNNDNIIYWLDNTYPYATDDPHWNKGTWRDARTNPIRPGAYKLAYYSPNYQNHTAFSDGSYQTKISGSKCAESNKAWASNSQFIEWRMMEHGGKPKIITDMISKGSITNLPPVNGNLCIELLSGVDCIKYNDHVTSGNGTMQQKYEDISWLCYKDLNISITDSNGKEYYSDDSIQYEADLSVDAEKELSYTTKIGTVIDGDKSAKAGVMHNNEFVTGFTSLSKDPTGVDCWYLEEHMMRVFEDIYTRNRYVIEASCMPLHRGNSYQISIRDKSLRLIPMSIEYNIERQTQRVVLIEV